MSEEFQTQQAKEYYNKGLFAFEKKNYDYAIELFSQALIIKRDSAQARHYLHLSAQNKSRQHPPTKLHSLLQKIWNSPLLLKAVILDIKKHFSSAIDVYEKILKSDPNNIFILTRLARDLLKQEDSASALNVFEEILAIDHNNIPALKNLGQLYSQSDNYPSARKCYEAVLKLVPHDQDAEKGLNNLAALGAIKESFGKDTG
jgi:tetratricopeptide (TPR) repeat protein